MWGNPYADTKGLKKKKKAVPQNVSDTAAALSVDDGKAFAFYNTFNKDPIRAALSLFNSLKYKDISVPFKLQESWYFYNELLRIDGAAKKV